MESHGLQDIHPKHMTIPKRYGAGMAHTVASIGHVLSCSYCGLFLITMDYRLSWIFVDYLGLWLIIMDYGLWWISMDYGLSYIILDYWGL
jgi:hypothetical protein